jgi:hypothetical protein
MSKIVDWHTSPVLKPLLKVTHLKAVSDACICNSITRACANVSPKRMAESAGRENRKTA